MMICTAAISAGCLNYPCRTPHAMMIAPRQCRFMQWSTNGMPAGEAHDNWLADKLLSRLRTGTMLLADRGYDADWIRVRARPAGLRRLPLPPRSPVKTFALTRTARQAYGRCALKVGREFADNSGQCVTSHSMTSAAATAEPLASRSVNPKAPTAEREANLLASSQYLKDGHE